MDCRQAAGMLMLVAALATACGGSTAEEASPARPASAEPVLIMVSDLTDDDRFAMDLLGDDLDIVLLARGDDRCDGEGLAGDVAQFVTCDVADVADAAVRTTGRLSIIAAGPEQISAGLGKEMLSRSDVFASDPIDGELRKQLASLTIVPDNRGREIADVVENTLGRRPTDGDAAALLKAFVARDDSFASFVVEPGPGGPHRVLAAIDLDRLAELMNSDPAAAQAPRPESATVSSAELIWRTEIGFRGTGLHSRSEVVGQRVFLLGFDGIVRALDRSNGEVEWEVDLASGPGGFHSSIVQGDDRVVVVNTGASPPPVPEVSTRRGIYAFDPETGESLWSIEADERGVAGHPLLAGDTVYFWFGATLDETALHAVDALTGRVRWRAQASWGAGQPLLYDETIYAGSTDGTLYGFDRSSGELRFEHFSAAASAAGFGVASSPVAAQRTLYFGSDDGVFHSVDIDTATELWTYDIGEVNLPSSPIVIGDLVVFGGWDLAVHAVDRVTGEVVWRASTSEPVLSSPAVLGESIVIGAGADVIGLGVANGDLLWRHETQDWLTDSPLVAEGTIYIQSLGRIEAIRPPSGP